MENVIEIRDLKKRYKDIEALCGINLTVRKGEIFGLLGPNGAGKSTLIKSLVGVLKPTSGEITVTGRSLPRDRKAIQQTLGYMPQTPALYEDISVKENIRFFAQSHKIENPEAKISKVIDFTALHDKQLKTVRTLSGGMKQRVSLACALVHEPYILFLDEPTAGVDPQLRESFWKYFRQLANEGVTIFITTHLMDEAEYCDRLGIIQKGQILKTDTVEAIMGLGDEVISFKQANLWHDAGPVKGNLAQALYPYGLNPEIEDLRIKRENLQQIILKLCEEGEHK